MKFHRFLLTLNGKIRSRGHKVNTVCCGFRNYAVSKQCGVVFPPCEREAHYSRILSLAVHFIVTHELTFTQLVLELSVTENSFRHSFPRLEYRTRAHIPHSCGKNSRSEYKNRVKISKILYFVTVHEFLENCAAVGDFVSDFRFFFDCVVRNKKPNFEKFWTIFLNFLNS